MNTATCGLLVGTLGCREPNKRTGTKWTRYNFNTSCFCRLNESIQFGSLGFVSFAANSWARLHHIKYTTLDSASQRPDEVRSHVCTGRKSEPRELVELQLEPYDHICLRLHFRSLACQFGLSERMRNASHFRTRYATIVVERESFYSRLTSLDFSILSKLFQPI